MAAEPLDRIDQSLGLNAAALVCKGNIKAAFGEAEGDRPTHSLGCSGDKCNSRFCHAASLLL
jgi:hypothetical protein